MSNNWNYGNFDLLYDMSGEISIGTGTVKVHDIFDKTPDFMKEADTVFVDPPASQQNLSAFYTKAGIKTRTDYENFIERLFTVIDEINPKRLYIEVFKSNKENILQLCKQRYDNVKVSSSTYYHKEKNVCWIIQAVKNETDFMDIDGIDEEYAIKYICEHITGCIADPCIGRGLVGWYANFFGKQFAGTELNKKRLAVLVHGIKTGTYKYR